MARHDEGKVKKPVNTPRILRTAKLDEDNHDWSDALAALGALMVLASGNAALSYLIFLL
nr:hypothetical protein [uncultured Roseococcus sp.]